MAWRFEPGERLSDAFRRVAEEEIGKIRAGLNAEDADHARVIHEARQGFKRLRALSRLGKPALGSTFARENRRWRDAGRLLSGLRDQTVLLESFDNLVAACSVDLPAAGVASLRSRIAKGAAAVNGGEDVQGVLRLLDSAAAEIAALSWPNGTSALFRGLRSGQASLRRKWKHARKREAPDVLHSWRKRVKDQASQLRLLRRVTPARYRARRNEEKQVGELLGEEHDLWMLAEWLTANAVPSKAAPLRDRLLAEIEHRRSVLRQQAFEVGEAFSSQKAGEFASAISRGWARASKRKARKRNRQVQAKM